MHMDIRVAVHHHRQSVDDEEFASNNRSFFVHYLPIERIGSWKVVGFCSDGSYRDS
jgi:hypothetical protein